MVWARQAGKNGGAGGTVNEKTEGVKARSSGLNRLLPKHSGRASLGLLATASLEAWTDSREFSRAVRWHKCRVVCFWSQTVPRSHVFPGCRRNRETGWVWGWSGVKYLAASEGCMGHGDILITPCPFALLDL